MSDEERPDPDELLARIQETEGSRSRAELKIFFGMSAGVGKTYAMLQEAHAAKAQGGDIVLGVIETHGRPRPKPSFRASSSFPADRWNTGASSSRSWTSTPSSPAPAIAVVDELAHANAPARATSSAGRTCWSSWTGAYPCGRRSTSSTWRATPT
jgi:two-component system sensor histidine kinase KdpD